MLLLSLSLEPEVKIGVVIGMAGLRPRAIALFSCAVAAQRAMTIC